MSMNKQIKLYSINLGMVKTEREKQLYKMKYINDGTLFNYKKKVSNWIKNELNTEEWNEQCSELYKDNLSMDPFYKTVNESNKKLTKLIKQEIKKSNGKHHMRNIDSKYFKDTNVIAVFDNVLTRTLDISGDKPTLDFIVIEVKNTDMAIVKQVIENGLNITERIKTGEDDNGIDILETKTSKLKFFTAGAGQTRQKKFMMIKEEVWNKYEKKLMCGLTIDKVNELGGMNVNKFNAYLALNNSASEVIEDFNIDECVVVDDFTINVNDEVDYISRNDDVDNGQITYTTKTGKEITRNKKKTEWNIKRQIMDVPIDYMDGAGICLESVFKKTTQIRCTWFKGIIIPINYLKYIKENNLSSKIKDIYGKEYDVVKDNIKVIFTKSQFKLWKYYKNILDSNGNVFMTGWEVYKACYKYYGCTFNKCMEDEDKLNNMRINYQMLQTLTDMSDKEIENLTSSTKDLINRLHSDKNEQLEFLGVNNKHRDYLQEILRLYPEMLSSKYIKKQLMDSITSYKKEAKSGKIKLNSKRVFIIPDLIKFMSDLFGDGTDYALERGQVHFNTYKDSTRLALLRSPHLSREWGLMKNINKKDNKKLKYFKTNGIYVTNNDLISKILMFDWDGDEALVIEDCDSQKWLLDLAEKQMKDLRPLYYEMGGGENKEINSSNTYNSLKFVYEKSNIGKVSNTLTNIWSKDDYVDNMDNIKLLCAYNNWIIDSAKKLELPKLPTEIKKLMNNKTYPYFFQYAKNKSKNDCRPIGNGVIDRICKSIDNVRYKEFNYSKGFGKFDMKKLMSNKNVKLNQEVIEFYLKLEGYTRDLIKKYTLQYNEDCDFNYKELAYEEARLKVLEFAKSINKDYSEIVDVIIKYSFEQDEMKLAFVFNVFGALIINNLNNNLELSMDNKMVKMCSVCGKRFKIKSVNSKQEYCNKCGKKIDREKAKIRMSLIRK